jgi:homocysteine S-methyltransferase
VLEGADALAGAGADAITIAENPLAVLRSDNLSLAHIIKERSGIETVIHLTCRDRNVLGLQTQIMGAHLLGLRGILAVTGDPASSTDQPGVSGVFDVNSFGLVRMISQFNSGFNMAGSPMKGQTDFSIGVAFSYRPSKPGLQIRRLEKKALMGAHFVMTQPIFDAESVRAMMEDTSHLELMMFPGIFPLISARSAEFLHNELPGITIPKEIRQTLWKYEKLEDQRKAGLEITRRLIADIAGVVDGLYLISPLNRWEVPLDLVKDIRAEEWQGTGKLKQMQQAA